MADATHQGGGIVVDRRQDHPTTSKLDPAAGTAALTAGIVLLLANLLWIASLLSTVLVGEGSRRLLVLAGLPAVLCVVAIVLIDFGLGRLRGAVTWLDRRHRG